MSNDKLSKVGSDLGQAALVRAIAGLQSVATDHDTLLNTLPASLNIKVFGAIGDGNSHPLSSVYSTLAAAQAVYPFVTSLTQELDWAATQKAIDTSFNGHSGAHPPVFVPYGRYVINTRIQMRPHVRLLGFGEGTSQSAAGLAQGYLTEFVAGQGFNDWAFVYDQLSYNGTATDGYCIADSEISAIGWRGKWTGPGDTTTTAGGMILFDGVYPIQGCRFEKLIAANMAQDMIKCNVVPLPGLFNNIWGRQVGGSVLNILCGPVYGDTNARTTHFFRASNIQGDFVVGPLIAIDGTPVITGGGSFAGCTFWIDGVKHEIDSAASSNPDPTNAYSKNCIVVTGLERAALLVSSVNVQTSNPLGGGTPNTVDGAVLRILGPTTAISPKGKGPLWSIENSRYGSSNATADFLVWDETHGVYDGSNNLVTPYKVDKNYRSASVNADAALYVGNAVTDLVRGTRLLNKDTGIADSYNQWEQFPDGVQRWGPGNAATDSKFYRAATGRLAADCNLQGRHIINRGGPNLAASDFVLTGWGTGATITVDSDCTDQKWYITITAGTSPSANPTVQLNFKDTTYAFPGTGPVFTIAMGFNGTGVKSRVDMGARASSNLIFQYPLTPTAGLTYIFLGTGMG